MLLCVEVLILDIGAETGVGVGAGDDTWLTTCFCKDSGSAIS